jgi:hypothetical protein
LNTAKLNKNVSRVGILCRVFNKSFEIWVDTGSPNTLVSTKFAMQFGLSPVGKTRYSGKVAGIQFKSLFNIFQIA